ncbi:MAG: peptidase domain-containing ABC transporter [Chryseolinea sp.]
MVKFIKNYRQLNSMDCGPACLQMICAFHHVDVSLEDIKTATQVGIHGTSLLGLADAGESFGFNAVSARLSIPELLEMPLPCIVHWDQKHFVVVTHRSTSKQIEVIDPAKGKIRYKVSEFLTHWVSGAGEAGIGLFLSPARENLKTVAGPPGRSLKIGPYFSRYRKLIVQLALSLVVGSAIQLALPYLTQSIVDVGISSNNLTVIQLIIAAQLVFFLSQTVVEFVRSQTLVYLTSHISLSVLSGFWMKLLRLPISFFESRHTGDIWQRVNDHQRIETFVSGTAIQTVMSIFSVLVFSIVLVRYDLNIFGIFLIGSLLHLLWIRLFLARRKKIDYSRFDLQAKENSTIIQLIYGVREIKLNNAEDIKRWTWEDIRGGLLRLNFSALTLNQLQQSGAIAISQTRNILITYITASQVIDGHLTLGSMLAIQYVIGLLSNPVEQLVAFSQQAFEIQIAVDRLREIHRFKDEEPDDVTMISELPSSHEIAFNDLSFAYPGPVGKAVLTNISATIPARKVTAIVGESGSGKTTILRLIQKFYSSFTGNLTIGDQPLNSLSPRFWRAQCGSVMQDGYLFTDTIANNIALGDKVPDVARLHFACEVASVHDFVSALPQGLDTMIGQGFTDLSTGQRQRILIARVVYKNPPFIFFDEATNALDANTEKAIMGRFQDFFKGKTVIVVAHRMSTIKNADKIIVLEKGRIVEQGTHSELTAKSGRYFDLIKNQLEIG